MSNQNYEQFAEWLCPVWSSWHMDCGDVGGWMATAHTLKYNAPELSHLSDGLAVGLSADFLDTSAGFGSIGGNRSHSSGAGTFVELSVRRVNRLGLTKPTAKRQLGEFPETKII